MSRSWPHLDIDLFRFSYFNFPQLSQWIVFQTSNIASPRHAPAKSLGLEKHCWRGQNGPSFRMICLHHAVFIPLKFLQQMWKMPSPESFCLNVYISEPPNERDSWPQKTDHVTSAEVKVILMTDIWIYNNFYCESDVLFSVTPVNLKSHKYILYILVNLINYKK